MATDNIFSGLKVVDFATFVAAPGAAVILSDFGADVIKEIGRASCRERVLRLV